MLTIAVTHNQKNQRNSLELHFELILDTLDVVAGLESVEGRLVLDQLALVLLDPLPVPVDVEGARPGLVKRLHVSAA